MLQLKGAGRSIMTRRTQRSRSIPSPKYSPFSQIHEDSGTTTSFRVYALKASTSPRLSSVYYARKLTACQLKRQLSRSSTKFHVGFREALPNLPTNALKASTSPKYHLPKDSPYGLNWRETFSFISSETLPLTQRTAPTSLYLPRVMLFDLKSMNQKSHP